MKRQHLILLVLVLTLIGATAGACVFIKSHRKLGKPGLKLIQHPVYDVKGNVIGEETIDLPDRVLNYTASTNLPVTMEELGWLPKDTTYGRRMYAAENFGIFVSVVMMGVDSRSIHKPEICLPGQGFKIDTSEAVTIPVQKPHPYDLPVMKLTASKEVQLKDGSKRPIKTVYVYWFVDENQLTADHADRMWRMGKGLLFTGLLQRWSYVACMAQCFPGQEEATFDRMKLFIAAAVPEFQLPTANPPAASVASIQ